MLCNYMCSLCTTYMKNCVEKDGMTIIKVVGIVNCQFDGRILSPPRYFEFPVMSGYSPLFDKDLPPLWI